MWKIAIKYVYEETGSLYFEIFCIDVKFIINAEKNLEKQNGLNIKNIPIMLNKNRDTPIVTFNITSYGYILLTIKQLLFTILYVYIMD